MFTSRLGFVVLVLGVIYIVTFGRIIPNSTGTVLVYFLLLPAFFYSARNAAKGDAQSLREGSDAKPISFVFKPEEAKHLSSVFKDLNEKGQLWLLTQTADQYYVFYQPQSEEKELPYATMYEISRSDISLVQVELQNIPK